MFDDRFSLFVVLIAVFCVALWGWSFWRWK
jgi:hypothetical protein